MSFAQSHRNPEHLCGALIVAGDEIRFWAVRPAEVGEPPQGWSVTRHLGIQEPDAIPTRVACIAGKLLRVHRQCLGMEGAPAWGRTAAVGVAAE